MEGEREKKRHPFFHLTPLFLLLKAFFCRGVRYRVTAFPDWTASRVKAALWAGGLGKGGGGAGGGSGGGGGTTRRSPPPPSTRPLPTGPADYSLVYAGRLIPDDSTLGSCGVPPVKDYREKTGVVPFFLSRRAARAAFNLSLNPLSLSSSQGCQALIAIETARLGRPPSPTSPYWD